MVGLADFVVFAACFGGGPYTPDDPCAISDVDQDRAVSLADFAVFMRVYSGPREDCNRNTVVDLLDILHGTSLDVNGNGVPDECECLADLDGDGEVSLPDLLGLLADWGTDPGGPPDLDGDGEVNLPDLLLLLGQWGPCP